MKRKKVRIEDISQDADKQLLDITAEDLMPLPFPCGKTGKNPPVKLLSEEQKKAYECSLDGVLAVGIPKPKSKEEEDKLVQSFLNGFKKLLSQEDNWTFWQQLMLSLESCVSCQTCNEACPIYLASGEQEIYRPTYRAEVLCRIKKKYLDKGGKVFTKLTGNDV